MDLLNLLSSPGSLNPIVPHLAEVLDSDRGFNRLQVGVPFLSWAGLRPLLEALDETTSWPLPQSDWVIGLHGGITEPSAVKDLAKAPGVRVHLFTGGGRVSAASLTGRPRFHAKVFEVDVNRPGRRSQLMCSSANITQAALGPASSNFEAGISRSCGDLTRAELRVLNAWWMEVYDSTIPFSSPELARYVKFREQLLQRNPDMILEMDPPTPDGIAIAGTLWIHAGAMSGGSRNQIEFSRDTALFFSEDVEAVPSRIDCQVGTQRFHKRPLSIKTTTFGVQIGG